MLEDGETSDSSSMSDMEPFFYEHGDPVPFMSTNSISLRVTELLEAAFLSEELFVVPDTIRTFFTSKYPSVSDPFFFGGASTKSSK